MKVYVWPADLGGCGYYRLIWPAQILREAGHDVQVIHPKMASRALSGAIDGTGQLAQLKLPADADVMVFQRITSARLTEAIPLMRANGVSVVIDIDDDLDAIEPSNPAWQMLHPRTEGRHAEYSWRTAAEACKMASWVTVSSDALLARYAVHGRGSVLRNAVPGAATDQTKHPRVDSDLLGWAASLATHPNDPGACGPAIGRLQREGYRFRIVGDPIGCRRAFQLDAEPDEATGPTTVDGWFPAVAALGVGIAPLASTRFNVAKSWLKPLEMAALGVPCVFTPTPEYLRLHRLGVGEVARNPTDWYVRCSELLRSADLRHEVSERGRAAVAQLTIQDQAWRWWEAWTEAYRQDHTALGQRITRPELAQRRHPASSAKTDRSSRRSAPARRTPRR